MDGSANLGNRLETGSLSVNGNVQLGNGLETGSLSVSGDLLVTGQRWGCGV